MLITVALMYFSTPTVFVVGMNTLLFGTSAMAAVPRVEYRLSLMKLVYA